MKSINTEKIILASKSPRRKELLEQIGIHIEISPSDVNEETVTLKSPAEYVKELSKSKKNSAFISGLLGFRGGYNCCRSGSNSWQASINITCH